MRKEGMRGTGREQRGGRMEVIDGVSERGRGGKGRQRKGKERKVDERERARERDRECV